MVSKRIEEGTVGTNSQESARYQIEYIHMTAELTLEYANGVATISRLLENYRSLLQNIVSFIWLFDKRDL